MSTSMPGNFLLTEVKYLWLVVGTMQNSNAKMCVCTCVFPNLLYYMVCFTGSRKRQRDEQDDEGVHSSRKVLLQ